MQMSQVVRGPGCKQLRKRYGSENRVDSLARELSGREVPRTHFRQILRAQAGELVEELRHGPFRARFAVEGLKLPDVSLFEDDPRPPQPIDAFAVVEMTHDFARAPGVLAFVAGSPGLR